MTTAIKRRRGTTAQHATFTGLEAELTVDTTKDTVVVHDGATAGGIPLLREDLSNNTAVVKNNVSNTFTTNQIISANSTSDALRITQTGTGNALVVEDSANPDATPFVVNSIGQVGVGVVPQFNLHVAESGAGTFAIEDAVDNAFPLFFRSRKARGNLTTKTIVANGDNTFVLEASGYDGANFISSAYIQAQVDGTPGTNDMPGRLVFSTTADGASSPTERMRIDSAGRVGIGSTALTGYQLRVSLNATGSVSTYPVYASPAVQSDVTTQCNVFSTFPSIQDAAFTLPNLRHFQASQGTKGASATLTNQIGFEASSTLTGATNNYGFYSAIASGTGRYNFYAAGTADNYFAGNVGIGSVPFSGRAVYLSKTVAGSGGYGWAFDSRPTFDTATTVQGINYFSNVSTQDGSNVPSVVHFYSQQGTISGGTRTAPTTQYGFFAESSLTGATNNYGFHSAIASGTGRYNFYAAGSADNYFAGKVITGSDSIQVNAAKTPASATAAGTTGQIAWDANYVYVCVATNTWKRTAIATW